MIKALKRVYLNEHGSLGMMGGLIGIALGLAVIALVFVIIPHIGDKVSASMPATRVASQWNVTENTNITRSYDVWATNGTMISTAVLISIVAVVLGTLIGLGNIGR